MNCLPVNSYANASAGRLASIWILASLPWLCVWWGFSTFGGWPLNDDPFYAKPVALYSESGKWQLVKQNGELTASSVGHLIFGYFSIGGSHFSYRRLFLACIAQQSLGIAAIYLTSRKLQNSVNASILVAASLGSFPLYFGHAFTFMTDGPAAGWAVVAMCCSAMGVIQLKWPWLLAASIAIGLGFWIRQTNGILFLAPAVALFMRFQSGTVVQKPSLSLLSALYLPCALALITLESGWLVESSVSRMGDVSPAFDVQFLKNVTIATYGATLLFGWFSLPWLLFAIRGAALSFAQLNRTARLLCTSAATLLCCIGLVPFLMTGGRACITNATGAFIQNAHFGPIFLSDMDEPGRWSQLGGVEWPLIVWQLLTVLSIASSAAVAWWIAWTLCMWASIIRKRSTTNHLPHFHFAVGILVTLFFSALVLIFFIEPHMDRYWLFALAAMTVWTLIIFTLHRVYRARSIQGKNWRIACFGWAIACIAFNIGLSIVFTHDMLAWNNARWLFINEMIDRGMQPAEIDGGRDVNAWLRLDEDPNSMPRQGDTTKWWSGTAKLAVSVGERPGWQEVKRLPWNSWATGRVHYLLVLSKIEERSVDPLAPLTR